MSLTDRSRSASVLLFLLFFLLFLTASVCLTVSVCLSCLSIVCFYGPCCLIQNWMDWINVVQNKIASEVINSSHVTRIQILNSERNIASKDRRIKLYI